MCIKSSVNVYELSWKEILTQRSLRWLSSKYLSMQQIFKFTLCILLDSIAKKSSSRKGQNYRAFGGKATLLFYV